MSTPRLPANPGRERPLYQLRLEPDGRSWTVREDLVDILERELLGPANGPEEVLDGVPDSAYLVGRIAPARLRSGNDDPTGDDDESPTDVGDAVDAELGRGVPVTAVDDSAADGDEDTAIEDEPQRRGLMIPASMGLRCQIPGDLEQFTITASWGVYKALPAAEDEDSASRVRRHKRTPVQVAKTIKVADLSTTQTTTEDLMDSVVLRIDRHDNPSGGCKLIEIALCNDRETPRKIPADAWLFQTKLHVSAGEEAVFLPVTDVLTDTRHEPDDELRRLNLQYRDRLEYAIGRTCSVDWKEDKAARRAHAVWTTWLPAAETPPVEAETIKGAPLDMIELATASREDLRQGLERIITGYGDWLHGQERQARALPEHLRGTGVEAVEEAWQVHAQLAEGLGHLLSDEDALSCFRFMNHVMAEQRIMSQVARLRAGNLALSIAEARAQVLAEGPRAHSWYTFQLAFVLMQIPLLTQPTAAQRSGKPASKSLAKAQLLFFPTGGGKTEAYLGLAAYTFAIRRLQARNGPIDSPDGPLDSGGGVAVLMRYTLRLLTAQQFQRATALVCAAELARQADPGIWGNEPFRIGLWVGTDVSPKRYDEAEKQHERALRGTGARLTVLQVQRCPWCGTKIDARDLEPEKAERRIYVFCGDQLGDCPFARGGDAAHGLPVLTVDEEIYRLAPAFLIATVDKFARLAREGEAASIFGYVSRRCDLHGYVHPDYRECQLKDGSKHKGGGAVHPVPRLRPPDLIIQDELHLITGALGTTVGLFEVAVDELCSWRSPDASPDNPEGRVKPLVVASTATARNAPDQVISLYGRNVTIFPPLVLDVADTFFSKEQEITPAKPGRRYIGVSTTGIRLTTAEIRVAEVLMATGQLLLDRAGDAAEPYMSLVGYFSATRELAGMARYMGDDIQTALANRRPWSLLPRRTGANYGALHVAELTSRIGSADITATLDQMAVPFDPAFDSSDAKRDLFRLRQEGTKVPSREMNPFDVILATSMLQVGVDVTRLGLMLVVGQPKNTAEYIQASSRVGRGQGKPGLVLSLGNWARPRDLAHFEQFRHYHETFYSQVEALSVTPYSLTSLDRGMHGALVSAARVVQAVVSDGLSPERNAGRIESQYDAVGRLIDSLADRALLAGGEDAEQRAKRRLDSALDQWVARRKYLAERQLNLVYERVTDEGQMGALMMSAESAQAGGAGRGASDAPPFVVPNSMREVQPEINLLVSPLADRLFYEEPANAPKWKFPPSPKEGS